MPFVEKKRVAKDDEAGRRLVQLFDAPGGRGDLGWSDLWSLTEVREFDDEVKKDGCWIVQIAYILRDQHGRVGVYERAAKQNGERRYSPGFSVLSGSSLLGWGMLDHHDVTFVDEYPSLEPLLPPSSLVGGIRYRCLGVGYSTTKRLRVNEKGAAAEKTRRYLFVVYEARVQVTDGAGTEEAPIAPTEALERDLFRGLVPAGEAITLLERSEERLNMDLAVLDALAATEGVHERGSAAKRQTTSFRLREPRGSTRPLLVRAKAWSDRHPWIMVAIWAGSLLVASIADLRGALGY